MKIDFFYFVLKSLWIFHLDVVVLGFFLFRFRILFSAFCLCDVNCIILRTIMSRLFSWIDRFQVIWMAHRFDLYQRIILSSSSLKAYICRVYIIQYTLNTVYLYMVSMMLSYCLIHSLRYLYLNQCCVSNPIQPHIFFLYRKNRVFPSFFRSLFWNSYSTRFRSHTLFSFLKNQHLMFINRL